MKPTLSVRLVALVLGLVVVTGYSTIRTYSQVPQQGGFSTNVVRFYDDSAEAKKPLPDIPKQWDLLAVSKGERTNEEVLWFRDKEAIYRVSGFFDKDTAHFTMNHTINKISSE